MKKQKIRTRKRNPLKKRQLLFLKSNNKAKAKNMTIPRKRKNLIIKLRKKTYIK